MEMESLRQSNLNEVFSRKPAASGSLGNQKAHSQEELNRDFMVWIALDLEPFMMVNNKGMRFFFEKNFPPLKIPNESTLRKSYLNDMYDMVVDKVLADLASVPTLNLMFDG